MVCVRALLRKVFSLLYHVLYKLIQIITGIELPCEVRLGKGFVIDHFGGIVISGYVSFGDHCRIRNGVVVGLKNVDEPLRAQDWPPCGHWGGGQAAGQYPHWQPCGGGGQCRGVV